LDSCLNFYASTATGQLLFLPLLANLTVQYGWRVATWAIAVLIALAISFSWLNQRKTTIFTIIVRWGGRRLGDRLRQFEQKELVPKAQGYDSRVSRNI
jgi:hypothetical protein